ncbi:MAG TPA: DegT/DnrJ/EryC1/StrS family aminotransferase, partial [Oscillatoriaceae cyanobacterium]
RFEQAVAQAVNAPHAIATTSCTTALHLALLLVGVGPGDEVICPSMSFIATANAIVYCGAKPVFAEIDARTYTIDPASVEALLTPRTKAILVVHQGVAADLDELQAIADARGLAIVEDAAPAIGCTYRGRAIGDSPNPVCFSFHPRKVVTSGEGGLITVRDAESADRLRRLRHHGMSVSDLARHNSATPVFEHYDEVGYNYRMTDLQAALGLAQMGRLETILAERRRLAARYETEIRARVPWLEPPVCPGDRTHSYQSYIVRLKSDAPIERDALMAHLQARGVASRRGIMCAHLEPAYAGSPALPVSEQAWRETLILPLFPGMTDEDQEHVLRALESAS